MVCASEYGGRSAIGYFGWLRIVVDRESVRWYIGGKGGYPRGSIARLRIERVQLVELGFREAWRALDDLAWLPPVTP